jgi:hypothetical protein
MKPIIHIPLGRRNQIRIPRIRQLQKVTPIACQRTAKRISIFTKSVLRKCPQQVDMGHLIGAMKGGEKREGRGLACKTSM